MSYTLTKLKQAKAAAERGPLNAAAELIGPACRFF
jgi:hypothetical protein